jgi:hypothetical protein
MALDWRGEGVMGFGGGAGSGGAARGGDVGHGGPFVEGRGLFLYDLQRPAGADIETGAQPVAVDVPDEDGLALSVQLKRALGAGARAAPAAVAERAVYLDDLSLHGSFPLVIRRVMNPLFLFLDFGQEKALFIGDSLSAPR